MSFHRVKVAALCFAAVALGFNAINTSYAIDLFGHTLFDQTGCCERCPACDHCCELNAEAGEESRPCFNVETKVICIPRVVFPWQMKKCFSCDSCDGQGCNNCVHNGAKARRVCVMKADKYTCPKCQYSWTPREKAACDAVGCDSGSLPAESMPTSVSNDPSEKQVETEQVELVHRQIDEQAIPVPQTRFAPRRLPQINSPQ